MSKEKCWELLNRESNKAQKPIITKKNKLSELYRSEFSPINMQKATGYFMQKEA